MLEDVIPATKPEARRHWVEGSPHFVGSVEELHDRYKATNVSLGIMRPKEVTGIRLAKKSAAERAEWKQKEKDLLSQAVLFDRPPKPLDFPEVSFRVTWLCDHPRCTGHDMGLLQWGLHELYRKLKRAKDPERDEKVMAEMHKRLDLSKKDVFFFLGSYRSTMFNFGLMDTFSTGKRVQETLF